MAESFKRERVPKFQKFSQNTEYTRIYEPLRDKKSRAHHVWKQLLEQQRSVSELNLIEFIDISKRAR